MTQDLILKEKIWSGRGYKRCECEEGEREKTGNGVHFHDESDFQARRRREKGGLHS